MRTTSLYPPAFSRALTLCAALLVALAGCDARTRVLVGASDGGPKSTPGEWTETALTVPGDVHAIWATDDGTRVWAAGCRSPMSPLLWRFDGERFVEATPPELAIKQGSCLSALWGSADGKLWTADRWPTMAPWYFDGSQWTETKGLPTNTTIEQIRGHGETAWLVGSHAKDDGLLARWDGAAWDAQLLAGTQLWDIASLGLETALAIGQTAKGSPSGVLWQLDGANSQTTGNELVVFRLACTSPQNDVVALLGRSGTSGDIWARWTPSAGLLPVGDAPESTTTIAACGDGHAVVVSPLGQGVLELDAEVEQLASAPPAAALEGSPTMAVSRTDIWLGGASVNQIWRLRRPGP